MKKLSILIITSLLFANSIQAQFEIEKLFGGATINYAMPVGNFSEYAKGGIGGSSFIGYNLTNQIAVGGEYNVAFTGAIDETLSSGLLGLSIYGLETYLAKGWYKFTDKKVKPYASLGLGLANVVEPDITDSNGNTLYGAKRKSFAANAELALSLAGFNLTYAFFMNGKAPKESVWNVAANNLAVNYHRFGIGYTYNF